MSGKTFLSLSCFAEACQNPNFKEYRLIFDDVEGGALMDIEGYFGKEVARRLEPPNGDRKEPEHSTTVESFYDHLNDRLDEGKPLIYVLDSQDGLTSDFSEEKYLAQKVAREEGKESKGSYGDGKAKYHSEHLRLCLSKIRKTNSILIIIGQTRDNLGFGFAEKTRSGGRALRFYANLEIWSSVVGQLTRTVRGKKRVVGSKVQLEVKKNRVSGKIGRDRSVIVPIYYGLGIDDVGSCVDFLVREKHWKKRTGTIVAPELETEGQRSNLLAHIETNNLERKVALIAAQVWKQLEQECLLPRKRRYV